MDHALRSISYIADIGDLLVIMARRRLVPPGSTAAPPVTTGNVTDASANASGNSGTGPGATGSSNNSSAVIPTSSSSALAAACDDVQVIGTTPKMICHVFESEEVGKSSIKFNLAHYFIEFLSSYSILSNGLISTAIQL